uniref:AlNc14C201G8694 protein n=1 Tax=Albugo laibachii Nc14 TaxID=890382 RepID=F0WQN3_9STRA|nr:AlNc14C201G8694 [Albugo laibachii Nc14]|eukprot:CCA23642.1 AlNc14C201G8694 [Albugo laibachii Nc14]
MKDLVTSNTFVSPSLGFFHFNPMDPAASLLATIESRLFSQRSRFPEKTIQWPFTLNALCSLTLIDYISINTNDNTFLRAMCINYTIEIMYL